MVKRNSVSPQTPPPSYLIKSKETFKSELSERIEKGENILNMSINTAEDFSQVTQQYYSWNDYNSELLKASFDNQANEYKYVYDRVNNKMFYGGGQTSFREDVEELKNNIKNKISNLDRLVAKIPLLKSNYSDEPMITKRTKFEPSDKD